MEKDKTKVKTKPKTKVTKILATKKKKNSSIKPRKRESKDKNKNKELETKKGTKGKYIEAIGRRKTSRARVRLFLKGGKGILVNGKPYKIYFPLLSLQQIIIAPLELMKLLDKFEFEAKLSGGGIHSQSEALRHGISRVLVKFNPNFRKKLKKAGFLTRDPRERERKKFGLKRARRAPQWRKR